MTIKIRNYKNKIQVTMRSLKNNVDGGSNRNEKDCDSRKRMV